MAIIKCAIKAGAAGAPPEVTTQVSKFQPGDTVVFDDPSSVRINPAGSAVNIVINRSCDIVAAVEGATTTLFFDPHGGGSGDEETTTTL